MSNTFEVNINGEWVTARKFNKGERVQNELGRVGTVIGTEDGELIVSVDWDEENVAGKKWLATSLTPLEKVARTTEG